ncbi:MAG: hypothetical protein ACI957_002665 [Verrucomicrobiales bacterium]
MIGLVGLIDLSHGGRRDFSENTVETAELRGHDQLETYLTKRDLLVADRLHSSYEEIARQRKRNRIHRAQSSSEKNGLSQRPENRLQKWEKPRQPALSRLLAEEWEALPEKMEMRIIRTKGPNREGKQRTRHVVTMIVNAKKYPWEEVASL